MSQISRLKVRLGKDKRVFRFRISLEFVVVVLELRLENIEKAVHFWKNIREEFLYGEVIRRR